MASFIIQIPETNVGMALLNYIKEIGYSIKPIPQTMENEQKINSLIPGDMSVDITKLCGEWKDNEIDATQLREQAWQIN